MKGTENIASIFLKHATLYFHHQERPWKAIKINITISVMYHKTEY